MGIEIRAVGGYNEVGRNMTAVKVDDQVIILDMGLHLEPYIAYTEDEDFGRSLSREELLKVGAVPDDRVIDGWRDKVRAIIPTHAHLDHVGALPYLAKRYKAPILCTPYTKEIIKAILADEKIALKNDIRVLNANSQANLTKKVRVEFINMTHSIPQTVMVALHTPYGIVLYANDFKFDNQPIIGKKPNYEKLRQLGKDGILALICDCTRARTEGKTLSENIAREMLKDVLLGTDSTGKAVIVTTFSSHIARLKSIVEFGGKMGRKVVFLGRSLSKYVTAAENIDLVNFSEEVEMVAYGSQVRRKLKQIEKDGPEKYLMVVTGHQGEPKATLSKMAGNELHFPFSREDHIVFSCGVIPSDINIMNRTVLEEHLNRFGVRIFKDIHVSGHAAKEDLRELLNMVRPRFLFPAHGNNEMKQGLCDLALEKGYAKGSI